MFFKKKEIPLNSLFPEGFVDIHSHLLPGIDDGAKNLEKSMALISRMYSYGIKNFVTTPHIMGNVYPNTSKTILTQLAVVRKALSEKFDDVIFNAAAEYMLDTQFCNRLSENDILTIKAPYVLVEMSYFNAPINLYEILCEIQLKGYKPILAHPERYIFYHQDFKNYDKLKKVGCYFQLNLLSLTEFYGKNVQKISQRLLREDLYNFVGTDTHHIHHLELLKRIGSKKIKSQIEPLLKNNTLFFDAPTII